MITSINEILAEWAFRTKSGIPNPKSMAHQILLEGILKNYGWSVEARAELLNNLVEANADVVEPTLAKARKKADKGQTYSSPRSKKVYTRGKEEEEGEDSEKGNSVSGIEMPDLDLDMKGEKIGDILAQNKEIVYPLIQKTAGKVEELLKDGKKEESEPAKII